MKTYTTKQFERWGAQGGKKSRRTLTTQQANEMNKAKKDKRKLKPSQSYESARSESIDI